MEATTTLETTATLASPYRSASELADYFGVSLQTILRASRRPSFPVPARLGVSIRAWRWRLDEVEAWATTVGFDGTCAGDGFFDASRRRRPRRGRAR